LEFTQCEAADGYFNLHAAYNCTARINEKHELVANAKFVN
jgi:hypothetical protein